MQVPAASSPARLRSTGLVTAINRAGGATTGTALAAQLVKFHKVPDAVGPRELLAEAAHACFGRQYRVIKIQNNKARRVGTVVAKVVPTI